MSVEAFSFFIGAALLLAGILGGGVKIKEIEFPTLSKIQRVLSVLLSIIFIAVGLLFRLGILPFTPTPVQTVSFSVTNELGDNQRGEEFDIYLDGTNVGRLHVDEINKNDTLEIQASAGMHQYSIVGGGMYKVGSEYKTIPVAGEGEINAVEGAEFSVQLEHRTPSKVEVSIVRLLEFHGASAIDNMTLRYNPFAWDTVENDLIRLSYSAKLSNKSDELIYCSVYPEIILRKDGILFESLSKDEVRVEIPPNGVKEIEGALKAEKRADPSQNIVQTTIISASCSYNNPDEE